MRDKISDKQRLQHILKAISAIQSFVKDASYDEFSLNSMMQYACVANFGIIGEASDHLSPLFKEHYNSIDWRRVKAFRNVIVHEYFKIDIKVVWQLIENKLPELKQVVKQALTDLEDTTR